MLEASSTTCAERAAMPRSTRPSPRNGPRCMLRRMQNTATTPLGIHLPPEAFHTGHIELCLHGALVRPHPKLPDGKCELTIRIPVEVNHWQQQALAWSLTYNAPLHDAKLVCAHGPDALGQIQLDIDARIKPDEWIGGAGAAAYHVTLQRTEDRLTGTFTGRFQPAGDAPPIDLEGTAAARVCPGFYIPSQRIRPAILEDHLQTGPAGRIADFAPAGRHADNTPAGQRLALDLPVFHVRDFGALPDSGRDQTGPIQAAIDAAIAAGGGEVRLDPGRYDLALDRDDVCLEIHAGRVRLAGASSGIGGTELFAHRRGRARIPSKWWLAGEFPRGIHVGHMPIARQALLPEEPPVCLAQIAEPANRGDRSLLLHADARVRPGDVCLLIQFEDAEGSLGQALTAPAGRLAANYRGEGKPLLRHYVQVERVAAEDSGLRAFLTAALCFRVSPDWRAGLYQTNLLCDVEVCSLRIATAWDGFFEHHRNDEHDNGWDGIKLTGVWGGRVRDVVFESVTSAAALTNCFESAIEDCRIVGNPGHNGFNVGGCTTKSIVARCHAGRQLHGLAIAGNIALNVFSDCTGDEGCGIDMHGSLALNTLYDRIVGCANVGGGSEGAVPPRHAHGLVFWNWQVGSYNPYQLWRTIDRICLADECPGFVAVGVHGKRPLCYRDVRGTLRYEDTGGDASAGCTVELLNQRAEPASLLAWQRERR